MSHYEDWDSLIAAAEKNISVILKNDVAPITEEIVKSHIQSDIYYTYTPRAGRWVDGNTYQRRHVLEDSINSTFVSKGVLLTTSTATASAPILNGHSFTNRYPGAFLKMLENGNMGIWKSGFPRPVISNAQLEIDNSIQDGAIRHAIENGIKREF